VFLHGNISADDCTRKLFKPLKDSASLCVCNENKWFWASVFYEWCCKWSCFRPFWPTSSGPRPKLLDGSISLKFLLETRLKSKSFHILDDLLGLLVHKLWSKINKVITLIIRWLLCFFWIITFEPEMLESRSRSQKTDFSVAIGNCRKLHTVAASNNRDHAPQSLLALLARATYIMVLFFTHIPFVVNHTINATPPERLQQHPLLFTTNHTDRTFFVWRLNLARPPHPDDSTILLRSEIASGMCAKLHTVAASNNRDHALESLLLLLSRATYIMVLFFMHIPFVVNHTINATPPERLQH